MRKARTKKFIVEGMKFIIKLDPEDLRKNNRPRRPAQLLRFAKENGLITEDGFLGILAPNGHRFAVLADSPKFAEHVRGVINGR